MQNCIKKKFNKQDELVKKKLFKRYSITLLINFVKLIFIFK